MIIFFFILAFIAVVLVFLISHFLYKRKLLRFFSSDYIDWEVNKFDDDSLAFTKNYWIQSSKTKKDTYPIDDLTWNDLDMDLLYSKINKTQSSCGSEILYNKVRELSFHSSSILNFHRLICLFQKENNLKVNCLVELFHLGDQDSLRLFDFLFGEIKLEKRNILPFYCLRTFFFLSILSFIFIPIEISFLLFFISLAINTAVYYTNRKNIIKDLTALQYIAQLVRCAKKLSAYKFPEASNINKRLKVLSTQLAPLSKRLTLRIGPSNSDIAMVAEYTKIILLSDFTIHYKAIAFIQKHQPELQALYELVGNIDSAIALSEYKKALPFSSEPCFTNNSEIAINDCYHPLVQNAVSNSLIWNKNMIITGSNASGKSTFVKALAINMIFAQSVGFTFSKKLNMKHSRVITSMAIKDSIQQKESYFIAEIKSLKRIIEQLNENVRCICFIDEILKGTNTIERIAASSAILKYLANENCLVSVASHDIELTEIMSATYQNYHFSETIANNEISFDYKLHPGATKTYNAILLLEYLHYHNEIIQEANYLADSYRRNKTWDIL